MASVYDLKPKFQQSLRPLIFLLARSGATANAVTVTAAAGSIGVGLAVAAGRGEGGILLLLPVWLFLRMALNAIDGMMARELRMASNLGAVLNEVGDVVSDIAIYLPLAIVSPESNRSVVAFTLAAVLTEFCGLLGAALGTERQYQGPMGKSDRALMIGAIGLVTALHPAAIRWWPAILWSASGLALLTCVKRCRATLVRLEARRRDAPTASKD